MTLPNSAAYAESTTMGTDWTHDPSRELEPGSSVLVVRPSNRPPGLQSGSVVRCDSSVLALALPLGEDFDAGEEILLVIHSAGIRFAGAARFISGDGTGVVTLHLSGKWRPVDARTNLRFPCAHPAHLMLDGLDTPWPATINDISVLGAGVSLEGCPRTTLVRMALSHNSRHATLSCRVVSSRTVESNCVLSLVFEDLNAVQRQFLDELHQHYRRAFLAALPLAG